MTRDVALLLDREVSHQAIVTAIESAGVKRLTKIKLFDVYEGATIQAGKNQWLIALLSKIK